LLQDDAVAVWVFVSAATRVPVWIEGRDLFEASAQHPRAGRLPLSWSRDVENQQIFGRRRRQDRMDSMMRELEVVTQTFEPEHHTVESIMILKAANDAEAETATVHRRGFLEISDGPGDSEMMRHGFSKLSGA
jgi:hypothetical protein